MKEISDYNDAEDDDLILDDDNLNISFLLKLVQGLPDRYRLVFNLYVLDNFSHQEISDMLNISIGTSKSNLSRARQMLKSKLERHQEIKEKA